MQGFFTGQMWRVRKASCHAPVWPGQTLRSEGTTKGVDVVDHHDNQVGRSPVGASVDQVQGIQEGSGL